MTKTRLEGWTEDEYKQWAASHPDEARTTERSRIIENEEVRADFSDQQTPKITGYAAVFNNTTEIWSGFFERVAPGAFSKTIQSDDVRALWNHNADYPLGRNKAGTLTLTEDGKGLRYSILAGERSYEKDLIANIKRGDVSQSSFGFNIVEQTLTRDNEKKTVTRTLNEVKLFDVSPVTFPAYPQTEGLTVRMTRHDQGEDEVIEVPANAAPVVQPTQAEELAREFERLKKEAF